MCYLTMPLSQVAQGPQGPNQGVVVLLGIFHLGLADLNLSLLRKVVKKNQIPRSRC